MQYYLKLLLSVYGSWIIECLDFGRAWKIGSGSKQVYSSVNSWKFGVFDGKGIFNNEIKSLLSEIIQFFDILTQSPHFYLVLLWYWYCLLFKI